MFDAARGVFAGREQRQSVVDVTRLAFLFKRVVPGGSESGALLDLVAEFRQDVLIGDKRQKPEIIGFLQVGCLMYRVEHAGYLWALIVGP